MRHGPNFQQLVFAIIIPIIILITVNWVKGSPESLAQVDSSVETSTPIVTEAPTHTPALGPTGTMEPAPGFTVEIVGPTEVIVGESIELFIEASNIPDPGIFGYQFQLNWDDTVFSLVEESLALNPDFPVVAKLDVGPRIIQVGASRQGDVEDLAGPLSLLSVALQANVVTEPDAAPFTLTGVRVGRKGGIEVPVERIINLDVTVVAKPNGSITGNVKVEGRADDNQAEHTIQDSAGTLSTVTGTSGDFTFEEVEPGIYTLTANRAGFLAATCTGLNHQGDTLLESVTLLAGDINEDRLIDIFDAVAIGSALGGAEPGQTTDLNADLKVDVLDLILMSVNFDQTAENNPWLCQPEGLVLGDF